MLKITKDIDKEKFVAFELGDGDDQLSLIISYAELYGLKEVADVLVKEGEKPGDTGVLLSHSGTIRYAPNRGSVEVVDD